MMRTERRMAQTGLMGGEMWLIVSEFCLFRRRLSTLAVFLFSQFFMTTCLRYHYATYRKKNGPNWINGRGDVAHVSLFGRRLSTLAVFLLLNLS